MRRNGNASSNRTYNPNNAKPAIPLDVDEVDSALERFIRQKYDQQVFSGGSVRTARRDDTGSTRSSDDQPPPLPPKPGKRFGFGLRSVSSAFTGSKSNRNSPPRSPDSPIGYHTPPSPIRVNKQSRVFGASVGSSGDDLESKLVTLRDMGFPDDKRNLAVLKGVSGNLEKAIESLVRLGEGSAPTSRSRTPMQVRNIAVSQPLYTGKKLPASNFTTDNSFPEVPAIYNEPSGNQNVSQLQQLVAQPPVSSKALETQTFNPAPNGQSQSATYQVEKAFEGIQISQPLFPNATGGYPSQHPPLQDPRLQQSMTPPVPQASHQHYQSNPYQQYAQMSNFSYNPFLPNPSMHVSSTPASPYQNSFPHQTFGSFNPYANLSPAVQTASSQATNGYAQQLFPNYPQAQAQQQAQQQQQQEITYSQPTLLQRDVAQTKSVGMQPHASTTTLSQPSYHNLQPLNYLPAQPTGRVDNSGILALYNYPHLAPQPQNMNIFKETSPFQSSSAPPTSPHLPSLPENGASESNPSRHTPQLLLQQRSATMPIVTAGSRNPFHTSPSLSSSATAAPLGTNGSGATGTSRHMSQESTDLGGFHSGRHSPDAFASLSARSVVR